jgi:hypothetical protein
MSNFDHMQKRSLECLRLAAECTELAASAHRPVWQAHFTAMAKEWRALAEVDPSAPIPTEVLN